MKREKKKKVRRLWFLPAPVPNIPRRNDNELPRDTLTVLQYSAIVISTMSHKFPKVQGGGSLIVAWQAKDRNIVVVGGGEVNQFSISGKYV